MAMVCIEYNILHTLVDGRRYGCNPRRSASTGKVEWHSRNSKAIYRANPQLSQFGTPIHRTTGETEKTCTSANFPHDPRKNSESEQAGTARLLKRPSTEGFFANILALCIARARDKSKDSVQKIERNGISPKQEPINNHEHQKEFHKDYI